jgi:selenocysteine lyase/cysteine desulfurase
MKAEEIDCKPAAAASTATSEIQLRNPALRGVDLRDLIVGGRSAVPVLDGTMRPYINLDNAASTPLARPVKEKVDELMEWYSAVHRGSGFKSMLSSLAYERAREIVGHFVGADLGERTLIFVRNTTEAINRCANRFRFGPGDIVLTTLMEHHSNMLSWRKRAGNVEYVPVDDFGSPDIAVLEQRLAHHGGRVKLVSISGGSNVTGVIPDIHRVARIVHAAGAMLLVDAAQLAPHRPIDMGTVGAPESIDFLAMSAHKMYAPMGAGVLIGPTEAFRGAPDLVGGGAVLYVSQEEVIWAEPPDNEEAGSPNVPGVIAMAAAARFMTEDLGWDWLVHHERDLTSYALQRLNEIPGLVIFGPRDPALPDDRLGVISFQLGTMDHGLTAAIMSHEYAIGTRSGCFCAHPYLMRLFHMSREQSLTFRDEIMQGDKTHVPGATRISFGFYNTRADADAAVEALWDIHDRKWRGDYRQDPHTGEYVPTESARTDPAPWLKL